MKKLSQHQQAVLYAVLAASFYAFSTPVSKVLLEYTSEVMLAGLIYFGAGLGMLILTLIQDRVLKNSTELSLGKAELKYVVMMVLLDIAAPILLFIGLRSSLAANVSLLNNFEIVATTMFASLLFRESISRSLKYGIVLITLSSLLLSFQSTEALIFSVGSLFVLMATICWGLENNMTRMISSKDTKQIVIIKGLGSGMGSLLIAMWLGDAFPSIDLLLLILGFGFISYGLSVFLYVRAQRYLGAAKTSAYYALAPFIGVFTSMVFLRELPHPIFWLALLGMALGTYYTNKA